MSLRLATMRENSLDRANLFFFNEGSGYFQGSRRQSCVDFLMGPLMDSPSQRPSLQQTKLNHYQWFSRIGGERPGKV
jgi:hypothetical protein